MGGGADGGTDEGGDGAGDGGGNGGVRVKRGRGRRYKGQGVGGRG